jgi:hypothetical protein
MTIVGAMEDSSELRVSSWFTHPLFVTLCIRVVKHHSSWLAWQWGRKRMYRFQMASLDAWKVHAALLLVQLNYGGYNVIAKLALSGGINQLVFCVLCDVVALVILGPLAYVKDK